MKKKLFKLVLPLVQEINRMEGDWKIIEEYIKVILLFEGRTKKSVIPVMGKAMNVLFGILTRKSWKSSRINLVI